MTGERDSHRSIRCDGTHETGVRKSRFVCSIGRVADEAEARAFLDRVRTRYRDARHHCTAYIVGHPQRRERSSDDGEPAGTAGAPMLEVLRRHDLTDTVAVVTRYFGGVLLGTGGLVRAYSGAVAGAVDKIGVVVRQRVWLLVATVDHRHAGALEHSLRATHRPVREVTYRPEEVRIEVGVPASGVDEFRGWLAEVTGGTASVEHVGEMFVDVTGT